MAVAASSEADAAAFARDGFLSLGRLLEPSAVETLRGEYATLFEPDETVSGDLAARDLAARDLSRNDGERMLQVMRLCQRNIHFRRLASLSDIVERVAPLVGPNLQLYGDQALYKPAGDGGSIYWHQDNAYWKCTPATAVTCWITLDDVDDDNGAIRVIPGSHRELVAHDRVTATGPLLDAGAQADETKAVTVDLPAGGAMLHHCLTFHASGPNRSRRQRRAFAFHYMAPGTTTQDGDAMPVSFEHPMVRFAG